MGVLTTLGGTAESRIEDIGGMMGVVSADSKVSISKEC